MIEEETLTLVGVFFCFYWSGKGSKSAKVTDRNQSDGKKSQCDG